jgi:O-antigen ligase
VTLLLSCVAAALQHYGAWPTREAFNGLEWTRIPFDRVYEPAPGAEGRYLAGGLLFHRLRFAHVTSLGALLALAVALKAQGRARIVGAVVAAVGLSSVALFPGARAAFVAAAGACAVLVLLLAASRRAAIFSVLGILFCTAALLVVSPALRARLLESSSVEGSGDRAGLVRAGVAAVKAHPFVGVGPGHYRAIDWAPEDASHFAKEHGGKTHNLFLTAAAEMGIPGALLLAYFLFWLARGYWRAGGLARIGLAVLALLVALGMLHDPLFHAEVSLAFALALGACRGDKGD